MQNNYNTINSALKELSETKSISSALLVCNTLLEYMGVQTKSVEDIELSKLHLPNSERYDRWFQDHPHFRSDRACFELIRDQERLDARFYALQKRSKLFIAGAVNFTQNFEDHEYTRNDPNMKVGIDFFLTPEKDAVIVVLSNKGSLRLVELSGRLTNTQHDIFTLWENVGKTEDKNIFHTTIWESFKLSSLNKKFYEGIANSFTSLTQHLQNSGTEQQLSNQFANRLLGRLLFLWFLRKKNIINPEKEYFSLNNQEDSEYYEQKLTYLFFNVLNTDVPEREKMQKAKSTLFGEEKENPTLFAVDSTTPYLNGGLFDQKTDGDYWINNKPTFPTGFFQTLYNHFDSFNFTTDESTPEYEQIAIDPEMLGRIFESFLATLKTETGAQAKKANGAFYTPREIVSYMSRESLRQYLYTALEAGAALKKSIDELLDQSDSEWALAGTNSKRDSVAKEDRQYILKALEDIKVLDPAVGSGAFPMGVLHKILSIFERLDLSFNSYDRKLSILKNNIYGVDINPTAIEISRLRAWLSIIVDVKDTKKIDPLPNLDFKFVCANSLIGLEKSAASFATNKTLKPELIDIREKYYTTSSKAKKEKLQKDYEKLTHPGKTTDMFDNKETIQLKSYQPFKINKCASFYDSELMHGVNGFDVVIGNPPYVQLQKFARTQIQKDLEAQKYQSFTKNADLYCLFYERGIQLLKDGGLLTYITSNKWMRAGYGEKLRSFFVTQTNPLILLDFGGFKVFESATVDTNILITQKAPNAHDLSAVHFKNDYRKGNDLGNYVSKHSINLKNLSSSSWFIGNAAEQSLKEKIEKNGKPLKNWDVLINKGLMTGYNKAFYINEIKKNELEMFDKKSSELIFRNFRGREICKYYTPITEDSYVIVTSNYININEYKAIKNHLLEYESKLRSRAQVIRGDHEWYTVDNCPSENNLKKYTLSKIIYPNMTQSLFFSIDDSKSFSNDKTFTIIAKDHFIKYLCGILNSKLLNIYLKLSLPRLGDHGYEVRKVFFENTPIPEITTQNKKEVLKIESLIEEILKIKKSNSKINTKYLEDQIDVLVYELYGLDEEEIGIIEAA